MLKSKGENMHKMKVGINRNISSVMIKEFTNSEISSICAKNNAQNVGDVIFIKDEKPQGVIIQKLCKCGWGNILSIRLIVSAEVKNRLIIDLVISVSLILSDSVHPFGNLFAWKLIWTGQYCKMIM